MSPFSNSQSYVFTLWEYEINSRKELRSLHYFKREDVWPQNFEKMSVGAAICYFSLKTTAAIELLVTLKVLSSDAITTAHFIKIFKSLTTSQKVGKHQSQNEINNINIIFCKKYYII